MVLHLFKKSDTGNHGFVVIQQATGFMKFDLVIDKASTAKNNNTDRSSSVHFGFMLPSEGAIDDEPSPVAIKHKMLLPDFGVNELRRQIRLAMKAGGQYNMKYLGCTAIESGSEIWIPMELCCKDTFDNLVKSSAIDGYIINAEKMKVCFRHIVQGLAHLHAEDIIHGEMVATNILLSLDRKRLKVANYDRVRNRGECVTCTPDRDINMTAIMFYNCLTRFKADSEFKRFAEKILISTSGETDLQLICKFVGSESNYPNVWVSTLRKIAGKVEICEGSEYLAGYLIMSMLVLDRPPPAAMEVLNHPFFWDDFKILQFIGRADALFRDTGESEVWDVINEFKDSCYVLFGESNWYERMDRDLDGVIKSADLKERLMKHQKKKWFTKGSGHWNMRKLLRVIRNTHQHYHDRLRKQKYFESATQVWKLFNGMYPGMICLLHWAIWKKRDSSWMPNEINSFFSERDGNYDLAIPE